MQPAHVAGLVAAGLLTAVGAVLLAAGGLVSGLVLLALAALLVTRVYRAY